MRQRKKNRFSLTTLAGFIVALCLLAIYSGFEKGDLSVDSFFGSAGTTATSERFADSAAGTASHDSRYRFPTRLRVGTYNLHNFCDEDRISGKKKFQRRAPKPAKEKEAIYRTILKVQPDVLAVQELGGEKWLEEIAEALEARGLSFPYRVLLEGYDSYNRVAIFSRVPFSKIVKLGVPRKLTRGLLGVVIPVADGKAFYFYTTHLKSKVSNDIDDPESSSRRLREARLVRRLIDYGVTDEKTAAKIPSVPNMSVPAKIKKAGPPTLFALVGDFNDDPGSAALAPLEASTFATALPAKGTLGSVATYVNVKRNYFNTFDRIFVSPTIYNKYYVPNSARIADFPWASTASDHRLVYADIDFSLPQTAEETKNSLRSSALGK